MRDPWKWTALLILMIGIPGSGQRVAAESSEKASASNDYQLIWSSVDGGGFMTATGGDYRMANTFGQADAGAAGEAVNELVTTGFWSIASRQIFGNGFESGDLSGWSAVVGAAKSSMKLSSDEPLNQ